MFPRPTTQIFNGSLLEMQITDLHPRGVVTETGIKTQPFLKFSYEVNSALLTNLPGTSDAH